MSKIVKCLAGVASMAAVACGAYFVYKNVIAKEDEDEDFDFDDSFEEEDEDATREYVSIQITSDAPEEAEATEAVAEEAVEEAPAADEAEEAVAEEENVELEEVTVEE